MTAIDYHFLQEAIALSQRSIEQGGFPVGALITYEDAVVATGISNGKQLHDPTSHAEIVAIRAACQSLKKRDLKNMTLYSSLEPCLMCYAASYWAYIPRVVYACAKKSVARQHYEGDHFLPDINAATHRPLEIVHLVELEPAARTIIENWEKLVG